MEQIRKVAYCPHCCNTAPQLLVHHQYHLEKAYATSDGAESEYPWSTFVAVCETCLHVLVYDNTGNQWEPEQFHLSDLVYPKSSYLHYCVPPLIKNAYNEAHRIKVIAPSAFAVQIRRALEAICDEQGANRGNLQSRLGALSDAGKLPPILSDAGDLLRLLGNIGAHGISETIHPLQANSLDEFFRAIVEYIYIAPYRLNEVKAQMKKYGQIKDKTHFKAAT